MLGGSQPPLPVAAGTPQPGTQDSGKQANTTASSSEMHAEKKDRLENTAPVVEALWKGIINETLQNLEDT